MPALALPALAILGALLALLILLGAHYLGDYLAHAVPDWHIPGFSSLRSAVAGLIDGALAAIEAVLDDAVSPIAKLVSYPVIWAEWQFNNIKSAVEDTFNSLWRITRTIIPLFAHNVLSQALQWVLNAEHAAETLVHNALAQALTWVLDAEHAAETLVHNALAQALVWSNTVLHDAETLTHNALAQALTWANDVAHAAALALAAAEARLSAAISTVDNYAHASIAAVRAEAAATFQTVERDIATAERAAVAGSIAIIDHDILDGITDVWHDVRTATTDVIDIAAGDFADVMAGVRGLERAIPADIAGVAAVTGALSLTMTRYLRDCGVPNCRNLSSLGRDLQALLGMVEDASFLALIVGLIHDPSGAARDIESTLGGLANTTIRDARDLLGVN